MVSQVNPNYLYEHIFNFCYTNFFLIVFITNLNNFLGRLPESSNIEEFKAQLFEGIDLITDDERRWPSGIYGLPTRSGKIKDLESFDATFFGVHAKQAHVMDPQLRMLLEITYEAIIDAGINPVSLRGTRTGVFIGVSSSESDEYWTKDPETVNGVYIYLIYVVEL